MKSVDELRRYTLCDERGMHTIYEPSDRIADEIEAEIAERYMLLPLDADGVPIRVGEVMNTPFGALPIGGIGCNRVWFMVDGRAEYAMCDSVCHIKPRTLTDVLADFAAEVENDHNTIETARKYADEIRELLGGDAE